MLSVIVPVYRTERFLEQCLDSILAQTYRDLEILLIDDGSPDSCGEICDRYAATDPRIRVFHRENAGLSASRNFGIEAAAGDYLAFVDSDDWLEPDMYRKLIEAAEKNDTPIATCGRFLDYADAVLENRAGSGVFATGEALLKALLIDKTIFETAWCRVYRREFFAGGLRFPVAREYEDTYIGTAIILGAHAVASIPDPLYHYRQRRSSIVYTDSRRKFGDYWAAIKARYDALIGRYPDREDVLTQKCTSVIEIIWARCGGIPKQERRITEPVFQEMIKYINDHWKQIRRNPRITRPGRVLLAIIRGGRQSSFLAVRTYHKIRTRNRKKYQLY